jgi:hypothetical protein
MAQIKGIAGITPGELSFEINRGGKFVVYRYCFSVIFLTMWRGTDIYFVRADQSRVIKGLPWTLLTLLAGWWGIPWGPIHSVRALWTNLRGGEDVTAVVAESLKLQSVNWATAGGVTGSQG